MLGFIIMIPIIFLFLLCVLFSFMFILLCVLLLLYFTIMTFLIVIKNNPEPNWLLAHFRLLLHYLWPSNLTCLS